MKKSTSKKLKYILFAVGVIVPVIFTLLKKFSHYFLLAYVPFNPFALYSGALVSSLRWGEVVVGGLTYFLFGYLIEKLTLKKFLIFVLPIFLIFGLLITLLVIRMYSGLGPPESLLLIPRATIRGYE